jgi:hypothetical protein
MSYLTVATTPEGPRVVLVYARTCPYQKQIEQAGLQNIQQDFQMFMQRMQQCHNERTAAWNQQVSGFEAHQNASQAQSSSWCDTITGLTQAHDPYTGESLKVGPGPMPTTTSMAWEIKSTRMSRRAAHITNWTRRCDGTETCVSIKN